MGAAANDRGKAFVGSGPHGTTVGRSPHAARWRPGTWSPQRHQDRQQSVKRINIHRLRHTFAVIALSEAGADLRSVSRAMGHARPSITLDQYGHLAPARLAPLMAKMDELIDGAL
jgi:integrase